MAYCVIFSSAVVKLAILETKALIPLVSNIRSSHYLEGDEWEWVNKNKWCENESKSWRHKQAQIRHRFILVRPYEAYVQSPCKILQEPSLVPKLGTPDYFLSGDSLSNLIFHSPEDSHPVVLIRCWGTNPVLAAQGTDANFWSGVALTNRVS